MICSAGADQRRGTTRRRGGGGGRTGSFPFAAGSNHRHGHVLVKLSRAIDWRVLEERFGSVYTDGPVTAAADAADRYHHPQIHGYTSSDQAVLRSLGGDPYFQFFCGEEFFRHRLVIRPLAADGAGGSAWAKRSCRRCCRRASLRSPRGPRR